MTKMKGIRIFLFLIGTLGIVLQVLDDGPGMFMYYTILSNLLVVLFLLYLILGKHTDSDAALRTKGGVVMAITITCVVYHILLSPTAADKDYYNIENFICHYILPIGFLADTLLFDRFAYKKTDPLLWGSVPVIYFLFAAYNGLSLHIPIPGRTSFYPYFFVEIEKYGWGLVLLCGAVILSAYIAAGYILYGVLRMLRKKYPAGQKLG